MKERTRRVLSLLPVGAVAGSIVGVIIASHWAGKKNDEMMARDQNPIAYRATFNASGKNSYKEGVIYDENRDGIADCIYEENPLDAHAPKHAIFIREGFKPKAGDIYTQNAKVMDSKVQAMANEELSVEAGLRERIAFQLSNTTTQPSTQPSVEAEQ
jgi:hypothetical protein